MRNNIFIWIFAALTTAGLPVGSVWSQLTARLQVIHNAADPAAAAVDIYVNGSLLLDDFAFRSATPFIDVPAGVLLNIAVAPGNSSSVGDALATFPVTLDAGKTYIAAANGVLDPTGFASNPDMKSIGFTLILTDMGQESGKNAGEVDIKVLHGATDAPTVDVIARGVATLVDDAAYGDQTPYLSVPSGSYTLDITPGNDNTTAVASFTADLSTLGGGAAMVFASGFLNPANNQNGEAFGLFAALPDGTVIELPAAAPSTARLQVIHNSADPAAAAVDLYINGNLLLDDFAFRAATPFITVSAGILLSVAVAPGNSSSVGDALATFPVILDEGKTYVVTANGVLDPSGFASNPDMKSTGFTLFVTDMAQESAMNAGEADITVLHGATDAPTVDVLARGVATLVDNAAYGDQTPYLSVPAGSYTLDITPGNDNSTIVASFTADLGSLGGGAAVVFASGFLNPAANQNGEAFGLFAALPDGMVIELPAAVDATARLQVIHNAADPAAAAVDIYVNGSLLLDDFAFRSATPFIDVPANVLLSVAVAPGNSNSVGDALATFPVTLDEGKTYVVTANGVLDPSGFASNPDMKSTGFTLFVSDMGQESAMNAGEVDITVLHGATDAPTVDVLARGVATLVDDAAYGDQTPYLGVPAGSYTLDITPGNDNSTIVASYTADLSSLGGGAAVVFASGFLNPAANQNGEAFGLFAALPDGLVIELPAAADATARLQVIHNAADPAAAAVDIYVNGSLLLDDFAFRSATPFIDVPANVLLSVAVAPGNSNSVDDALATFPVILDEGKTYVVTANGVLDPSGFASNPDKKSTGFTLFVSDMGQESAMNAGEVDITVLHGVTDAPTVDVIARGVATLVDDASYGDQTPYLNVPSGSYTLDITPGDDNSTIVASFTADLGSLGGGAAVVFASGFLNPAANQNGEPFGLFAALPDGRVIPLSSVTSVNRLADATPATFLTAFPNPVRDQAMVSFSIDRPEYAALKVFDITGREILSLRQQDYQSGTHNVALDASNLLPGMYRVVLFTSRGATVSSLAVVR
jgi:hypothetical protein